MIIGFTGTRKGMTASQRVRVTRWCELLGVTAVHHGGCRGADLDMHGIATNRKYFRAVHPSNLHTTQVFAARYGADLVLPEKPPLIRNRDIVDAGVVLIATPKLDVEEQRSGTWAAIRYARTKGKCVILVLPSDTRVERAQPFMHALILDRKEDYPWPLTLVD